jgi:hypothetical protein
MTLHWVSSHDRQIVRSMCIFHDITTQIFEATGPDATSTTRDFDRFWGNARTLTLHDRLDYKVHDLGQWYLNDQWPTPSFYSQVISILASRGPRSIDGRRSQAALVAAGIAVNHAGEPGALTASRTALP